MSYTKIFSTFGIKIFKDRYFNTIIQIPENLERWILKLCQKHNINIRNFGLPDNYDHLNSILHEKENNFQKLLYAFSDKKIPESTTISQK